MRRRRRRREWKSARGWWLRRGQCRCDAGVAACWALRRRDLMGTPTARAARELWTVMVATMMGCRIWASWRRGSLAA
ncbi:hypothetical protein M0R45_009330 [Rubus argutus]|uniref:Uncharacterized protein n=1 Tax=Rubus argutus TaxID=59490 RepID=A0AAW1Y455_RUBAR